MYHSITFGEKNTWDDWHLIPSSRPVFSPPQPQIRLLNVPGKSGSLDVTEAFGQVVYADRTGSFEFYVDHESDGCPWADWTDAYTTILNYLHGQKLKAYMEDDPTFYYEGRFSVNEWRSNPNFSSIVINYTVAPFKMKPHSVGDDWLWDPFNFENNDSVPTLQNLNLSNAIRNTVVVTLEGLGYRTIPLITCTQKGVKLYMDGSTDPIALSVGDNRPSAAVITKGIHTLKFVGMGYVSVDYTQASL